MTGVRATATRDALGQADDYRYEDDIVAAALAEVEALEAVADAAREVCITYHPRSGAKNPIEELRAALARLVAVQDGQTRGDGERAEGTLRGPGDGAVSALAWPTDEGGPSPRACPCKSHGDPDGDCGENCG